MTDKVYPIAGLMTRYVARLTTLNIESVQPDGGRKWFDTLAVFNEDGDEVDAVLVESGPDEEPYKEALTEAGWVIAGVDGITGDWRVRRA